MTPAIEPYRMIEPQTFTDAELAVIHWKQPTLGEVLWFAARYLFWMLVTYWFIVNVLL